jgi:hypothetical protein
LNVQNSPHAASTVDWTEDAAIAVALAALTFIIAVYFAPRGFQAGFVDMGHDGYQLRQVLDLSQGGVIFRDTFDQYGPLNGYLNLVGFLTLGRNLLALKYFLCLWYALIAVVLYAIARQWLAPPLATFTGLVWVGLAPFYNHGIMISPHAYALFFQALATLIALRSRNFAPGRFAAIGLLAGLSWAVKQSMGVFFLAAILAYLLLQGLLGRASWRRTAGAAAAVSLAFTAIVGIALGLLWRFGALGDWYLQTFAFPREFYLAASAPGSEGVIRRIAEPLVAFAGLQWGQPLYWILIRVVVLAAAVVHVIRRQPDDDRLDDLLLMALLTAFLWLGAYPSGNFMHQWWTTSLTFAPFVVCVHRLLTRAAPGRASLATVAVVSVIVGSGFVDRWYATVQNAKTLSETLAEPPVLRGIRTNPPTKRAIETLYRIMAAYRSEHPGTGVVSIESADGWSSGIIETLTFLSFLEDNPRPQPVYWSLPALSTTVYPRYGETLWRQVRNERPLVVEHYSGRFRVIRVSGYRLLAAAQSDYGHWYVYAPMAIGAADEPPTYLASDGALEKGFPADGAEPALATRLNPDLRGRWRGRVLPSSDEEGPFELPGDYPFEFDDSAIRRAAGPVSVYTWPADLRVASLLRPLEPVSNDVVWRAGRGDIVRDLQAGAWRVDGYAPHQFSYLLQWRDTPVVRGTYFVVRGEVFEGGLQIGFLEHDQWAGSVAVTRPGLFEAILEIQTPGQYALVAANCVESTWPERLRLHPIRGLLGLLTGGFLPNRFRVSEAGWIRQ